MAILKKQDFYNTFHDKGLIPNCYESIHFKNGVAFYEKKESGREKNSGFNCYAISLFPQYFTFKLPKGKHRIKKITQKNLDGFAIDLNGYSTADHYLKENLKSQTRSPILRRIKRLELCFDMEHKLFFGNISEIDYRNIMALLKQMLETRFAQKNDTTEILGKWDKYLNETHNKILKKEASLFVTYASNQIIAISLNYHVNKVFIGHIFCYDISYSKFSLGNMMVYKSLEWCCENNYLIMDMGNGDLEYKQVWCNCIYNYDYHFIYNPKSVTGVMAAAYSIGFIKIKNYLKTLKIDELYRKIKTRNSKTENTVKLFQSYQIEELNRDHFQRDESTPIEFTKIEFNHLKKPINDFLYLSKEHFNDLNVYQKGSKTFLIMGKQSGQKIIMD
ncbi:GNAT family N-acetyltransferase [Flavobacteriaceae bacterium SZ-1-7]|uniref:GNAT family N-acetyltransferase n=1 Tax=Tamlana sedimenti TaxID=3134126 RepID=UPI0031296919